MGHAQKDENSVSTLIAVDSSDGATVVPILADPTLHILAVSDGTTGSDNGPANALHDENHVPTLMAVSSDDGVTPVAVYADADGNLLIDSN